MNSFTKQCISKEECTVFNDNPTLFVSSSSVLIKTKENEDERHHQVIEHTSSNKTKMNENKEIRNVSNKELSRKSSSSSSV